MSLAIATSPSAQMVMMSGGRGSAEVPPPGPDGSWMTLLGYNLPGVPYPTQAVSSAIMPTLPTGADFDDHEWIGTYDPLTYTATTPGNWPTAEQANCYYVDKFHPSATDTANTYGYPDQPRLTIPTAIFTSSATLYAEIHGDNTAYSLGTNDYTIASATISVATIGTTSAPVVIKGVDNPWIGIPGSSGGSGFQIAAVHTIWDGLHIKNTDGAGDRTWPAMGVGSSTRYFCFRNGSYKGEEDPATSQGGQMITLNGAEFVVFFNSAIKDASRWQVNPTNLDAHLFRPAYSNRYLWLVGCELAHSGADCIQVGNSNGPGDNPGDEPLRTHYVWIADNELFETFENAIDYKNSFHCSSVLNRIHTFIHAPTATALLLSNNGEGLFSGWHWSINDEIYDTESAVRDASNHVDETNFLIGARIRNIAGYAIAKESGVATGGFTVAHCSIYNTTSAGFAPGSNTNGYRHLHACVFDTVIGITVNNAPSELHYCVYTNAGSVTGWDTTTGSLNSDPLYTNAAAGDLSLQSGSPALGIVPTQHACFATYEAMYGYSIAEDAEGTPLPATDLDAGAIQRVAA